MTTSPLVVSCSSNHSQSRAPVRLKPPPRLQRAKIFASAAVSFTISVPTGNSVASGRGGWLMYTVRGPNTWVDPAATALSMAWEGQPRKPLKSLANAMNVSRDPSTDVSDGLPQPLCPTARQRSAPAIPPAGASPELGLRWSRVVVMASPGCEHGDLEQRGALAHERHDRSR